MRKAIDHIPYTTLQVNEIDQLVAWHKLPIISKLS